MSRMDNGYWTFPSLPGICVPVGFEVKVSRYAMAEVWVFPHDRFVEWEKSDEELCKRLGIGHKESKPGVFQLGNLLVVHPDIWDQIRLVCDQQQPHDACRMDI